MKVGIIGLGNVGLAYGTVLTNYINENPDADLEVYGYDTKDLSIIKEHYLKTRKMTVSNDIAILSTMDHILVCISVDIYKAVMNTEDLIDTMLLMNPKEDATIILKSALPVGTTEKINEIYPGRVFYIPEFLAEGETAVKDIIKTETVFIGSDHEDSYMVGLDKIFNLLQIIYPNHNSVELGSSKEMEFIKLARNAYLATRVSFFSEMNILRAEYGIDNTFFEKLGRAEPLIGNVYNTPSFGFGGYCLPKDTKQITYGIKKYTPAITKGALEANENLYEYYTNRILALKKDHPDARIVFYEWYYKRNHASNKNSNTVSIMQNLLLNKHVDKVYSCSPFGRIIEAFIIAIDMQDILDTDIVISQFPDTFIREGKFHKVTPEDI